MQSAVVPTSWPGSTRISSRGGSSTATAFDSGTMTEKREPRPTVEIDLDFAAEHARHALDDRKTQAQPARDPGALIEAVEFDEDVALLGFRNADAGVVDVDAQVLAAPPAADQHAPRRRVFDGVGDQVLHQPAQQPAVRAHHQRTRHEGEVEPLGAGQRREFQFDLAHQVVDAEAGEFRAHHAGVEPRHIEQRAENLLHRLERGVDIVDQPAVVAPALALDQAGDVEPRRVERLQDVVARRGEEFGLGNIGVVGLALGARQRGVEAGEFLGALAARAARAFRWRARALRPPPRWG